MKLDTTSKSYKLYYIKLEVSDATTYRSKKDVPGQYLDIALVAGQYKIYCPAMSFDLPTQSVT